ARRGSRARGTSPRSRCSATCGVFPGADRASPGGLGSNPGRGRRGTVSMSDNPFRKLPRVDDVLAAAAVRALAGEHAHDLIVAAVRAEIDDLRALLKGGADPDGQVDP